MSERELTQEELEEAVGGKRQAQSGKHLQEGGGASASAGNRAQIGEVDSLADDPLHHPRG